MHRVKEAFWVSNLLLDHLITSDFRTSALRLAISATDGVVFLLLFDQSLFIIILIACT